MSPLYDLLLYRFMKYGIVWFKGVDLARLLDFMEPQNAIQHNVIKEDKTPFSILRVGLNPTHP